MYIRATTRLNDAIEKFRNDLIQCNSQNTYESARTVLDNTIISNIDEEIDCGLFNHEDKEDILAPTKNDLDITNTIDIGQVDGYAQYLIGDKNPIYMPDDQIDSLDDAYVTYIALVIMQKVTLHNMNAPR